MMGIKLLKLSLHRILLAQKLIQFSFELIVEFCLDFVCKVVDLLPSFVFSFLNFFDCALSFLER
jgi:hypothetical protein